MWKILKYQILILVIWSACKQQDKKIIIPDLSPHFSDLLNHRDTTLSLDSFYFITLDTMNEKKSLMNQKFALLHIMDRINSQFEIVSKGRDSFRSTPSANDLETIEYLKGEKTYVGKEIDSLNILIANADTSTPIGYRAFFKVTVSKKNKFSISDTIHYAITPNMNIADWNGEVDKDIDSLAVGKQSHSGGIH